MSRRLLVIEPDAAGGAMIDRVLAAEGFAVDVAASGIEARPLLDAGQYELALVDELAGSRTALSEVRWLRRKYPTVQVVVTGALLSRRVMQELLRLRVADVLAKPFTPNELREAVARAVEQRAARHEQALEYDVALTDARRALAAGLLDRARAPLSRAQAMSPFDAEIMGLWALLAELEGKDQDADRGYRAALALRDEEATPPPDPHEGLARLAAYAGAQPVPSLGVERAGQPLWLVTDLVAELAGPPPVKGPHVVVMALGLTSEGPGALFAREGGGARAYVLIAGPLSPEPIAAALSRIGSGPLVAAPPTAHRVDLARVEELRGDSESASAHGGVP